MSSSFLFLLWTPKTINNSLSRRANDGFNTFSSHCLQRQFNKMAVRVARRSLESSRWRLLMNEPTQPLDTINCADPFAMRYWSRQLRISEADLRKAIDVSGNSAAAVRAYVAHLPRESHLVGRPRG